MNSVVENTAFKLHERAKVLAKKLSPLEALFKPEHLSLAEKIRDEVAALQHEVVRLRQKISDEIVATETRGHSRKPDLQWRRHTFEVLQEMRREAIRDGHSRIADFICTVKEIAARLNCTENAVMHRLRNLELEGRVQVDLQGNSWCFCFVEGKTQPGASSGLTRILPSGRRVLTATLIERRAGAAPIIPRWVQSRRRCRGQSTA